MSKKNKKIVSLLLILGALLVLTGCAVATIEDPTTGEKVTKLIYETTTWKEIFESESWFGAFFVWPLAQVINFLTPIVGVGLAITAVTAGVHLLIFLFTRKSTIATQRMQTIQPEMDKINRKYEGKTDDASKMKQANEMQALYKKYDINPLGTIITSFVQFPVMFAIYHSVQRAAAVKTGTFLGLSLSTTPWQGITNGQYLYIVLFVVMLVIQIASMKFPNWLTNYYGKKEAEKHHRKFHPVKQAGGNQMMFMIVPMLLLSITWPAAMTLYWIISSFVSIVKAYLVQTTLNKSKDVEVA